MDLKGLPRGRPGQEGGTALKGAGTYTPTLGSESSPHALPQNPGPTAPPEKTQISHERLASPGPLDSVPLCLAAPRSHSPV